MLMYEYGLWVASICINCVIVDAIFCIESRVYSNGRSVVGYAMDFFVPVCFVCVVVVVFFFVFVFLFFCFFFQAEDGIRDSDM